MKKFFSLMLVALLLVSALPFQAFAAGEKCTGPHTYPAEWTITKEATCTENGSKRKECTACGHSDATLVEAIPATGHDYKEKVITPATCTTEGVKQKYCSKGCASATVNEAIPALGHEWIDDTTATGTPAACGKAGSKVQKCSNGCGETRLVEVDALEHAWDAGVVTKQPTCVAEGVKTFTCTRTGCGETKTEPVAATGIHNYVGGKCSVCDAAEDKNDTTSAHGLLFINEETDEDTIVSVRPGEVIDTPAGKKVKNMKFKYWSTGRNGTGTRVYDEQSVFGTADGQISATTFYAYYVEDKNDGLSYVDIIVRRYVNGKAQGADITLFEDIEFEDGDSIYDWLYAKRDSEIATKLFERVSADEYQWKNRYFYNYWSDEVMTKADLKADGSKAILIKVESLKSNAANVKLYLHKSSTSEDPFRILDMTGYTAGNYVSRSAVADLVEKYYSYKSIGNLYNEEDWEELMNGEDNNGRSKVLVEDNGYTEIHVVVTNANTKSNSKADSSNPKTGDYITIAVGTMVLAAAAVVTLAELKKRKMI